MVAGGWNGVDDVGVVGEVGGVDRLLRARLLGLDATFNVQLPTFNIGRDRGTTSLWIWRA